MQRSSPTDTLYSVIISSFQHGSTAPLNEVHIHLPGNACNDPAVGNPPILCLYEPAATVFMTHPTERCLSSGKNQQQKHTAYA